MSNIQYVLGIDTSNYTTSAALYCLNDKTVLQRKKLLPVGQGQCGLRQSDAVFHHTQQLHELIESLFNEFSPEERPMIAAVGVSSRPRSIEGSYMPCFTVGINAAKIIGTVLNVPVYEFSHQTGHIAAAIYSSKTDFLYKQEFIAFHVSGGTTEALLVKPDRQKVFTAEIVGKTLDLHAGQAIDRVGVSMGFSFPCGQELEKLALQCDKKVKVKTCVKNTDCCLSGIQNICEKMIQNNADNSETALTCITFVEKTLEEMCGNILQKYGKMPVLFAGGVMSNSIIKKSLKKKFDCYFAEPAYSADNACGTAVLCGLRYEEEKKL